MDEAIRILIADHQPIVRTGLRTLIANEPDMELTGEAIDGVDALWKLRSQRPGVVVLDILMPRQEKTGIINQIRREYPALKILVLTSVANKHHVMAALTAGALGYWLKDVSAGSLLQAIRQVYAGIRSIDPLIIWNVIQKSDMTLESALIHDPLTTRETDILKLMAQGLTNQDIAQCLMIGTRTVGNHISNILAKLQVSNRTQAVLYALRHGLAPLTPEPMEETNQLLFPRKLRQEFRENRKNSSHRLFQGV